MLAIREPIWAATALIAVGALFACRAAPEDPRSQRTETVPTSVAPTSDVEPPPVEPLPLEPPVPTPDSVAVWVPRVAPDTIPDWVFAPENRARKLLSCAAGDYVRNVVTVAFHLGATRKEKEAAIRAAGGFVIGGSEFAETDGFYYLKIDPGPDGEGLCRSADRMRVMPKVIMALPISFIWKGT
jgi:hypothetical protein